MIGVEKLRELTLADPGGDEGTTHISAASSLVRRGDTLYVVADDALQLGVFPAEGKEHGFLVPLLSGDLPDDISARHKDKADVEALTAVEVDGHEHGALLVFGSGSGDKRYRGSVILLREDGRPVEEITEFDLRPLYRSIEPRVGKTNIEGAVNWGDDLVLLNRGNEPESHNACVILDLEAAVAAAVQGQALAPDVVKDVRIYDADLGQHRGPQLCFSDASPLGDGRVVFSASTEMEAEGADGITEGSAIGILDAERNVVMVEPLDDVSKVEGLTARVVDNDRIEVLMVVDGDDPKTASPLLRTTLPV